MEKKRKQIVFDIHPDLHQQIKILAAQCNISMNLWMTRAIIQKIARDNPQANSYSSGFNVDDSNDANSLSNE